MLLPDLLDRIVQLKVGRTGSHERPHKPALLLAILSMIDSGRLPDNRLIYGPELRDVFRRYLAEVRSAADGFNMVDPFWRLRSEGLLEHQANPGFERVVATQTTAPSARRIQEITSHSKLPDDVFEILQDPDNRERVRQAIIGRYFAHKAAALEHIAHEFGETSPGPGVPTERQTMKRVDQTRHAVDDIFQKQRAGADVQRLIRAFHEQLADALDHRHLEWQIRTNDIGFTYLCDHRKAFLFVGVRQNFASLKFFTGPGRIDGLEKGIWLNRGDNMGSEPYRMRDEASLQRAVKLALKAYKIAANWGRQADEDPVVLPGGPPRESGPTPTANPRRSSNPAPPPAMRDDRASRVAAPGAEPVRSGASGTSAIQRDDPQAPAWIEVLLASPRFAEQKPVGGRAVPDDAVTARMLTALAQRGGKMTMAALARALKRSPSRAAALLAVAQRVLNIDGYPVLTRDDASGTVELNVDLLRRQFGLD